MMIIMQFSVAFGFARLCDIRDIQRILYQANNCVQHPAHIAALVAFLSYKSYEICIQQYIKSKHISPKKPLFLLLIILYPTRKGIQFNIYQDRLRQIDETNPRALLPVHSSYSCTGRYALCGGSKVISTSSTTSCSRCFAASSSANFSSRACRSVSSVL